MTGDSFTDVTERSWLSRLFSSIKSVLLGLLLVVAAFPLLIWNEGRAVRSAKSLAEGAEAVVSVSSDAMDAANEGKLVHMTGEATTTRTVSDPDFGVSAPAIKLLRHVDMYQWREGQKSETRNKLGGGTETVTTYTYDSTWSPNLIDSGSFKTPQGHENPREMPVQADARTADTVTLGAFVLSAAQVAKLNNTEPLSVDAAGTAALPASMKSRVVYDQGGYYLGKNPAAPAIGDERISFQIVRPATVSIVGRQIGNTFEPYQAKAGGSILIVSDGTLSADNMFKAAEGASATLTWILRGAGVFAMALGLFLIFNPVAVVASVVPFLGGLMGAGVGLFAFVVAVCLSLATIAVSWLAFRPIVGGLLLLAAVLGLVGLRSLRQTKPKAKPA